MPVKGLAGCPFGFEVFGSSGRRLGCRGVGGHMPLWGRRPIDTLLKIGFECEKELPIFTKIVTCNLEKPPF